MWLKLMPGVYLGVPADDGAFGQCEDCAKFRTSRRQMLAEAGRGDAVGIAYWQAVLRRACSECSEGGNNGT